MATPSASTLVANLSTKHSGLTSFGSGQTKIGRMDQVPKHWIPTAIPPLDAILGGGFPTGKISEVYGPEASYKSGLGYQCCETGIMMSGVSCAYDNEQSFDPIKFPLTNYDTFLYGQQNILEDFYNEVIDVLEDIKASKVPTLVLWDSAPCTLPREVMTCEIGKKNFGLSAAMHALVIPRIINIIQDSNCAFIIVNQVRDNMDDDPNNPYNTPGGWAIKFYASLRLQLEPRGGKFKWIESEETKGANPDGFYVQAFTKKNKCSPPLKKMLFPLITTPLTLADGNKHYFGGDPAMAIFHWIGTERLWDSNGGGRYLLKAVSDKSVLRKDFQKFYHDNLDKFLTFFEDKSKFKYAPEAREAVMKYTRRLYAPLVSKVLVDPVSSALAESTSKA